MQRGGGGAAVCAEPRNSCGQEAAGSGSDPPIAPPARWEASLRALHRPRLHCVHINERL